MTGPNGVRDKQGASGKSDRPSRRRQGAVGSPQGDVRKGMRAIKRYLWKRKYTLIYLLLLIIISFMIRSVWYYPAAYTGGETPLLSGNDPDYHKRTVDVFLETHHFLTRDPLLNYPGGGPNPNPPAYSTSVALVGLALSPFYGGDVEAAAWFSMEIGAALWAALTVIPVYLFTKEMFGRRSGYLAALFIAFMAGNVERTPLGFSDHDAFFMFFIVTAFFFLLKSLRFVKTRMYVRDWRSPRDITTGLGDFAASNKIPILYASMAGFALGAVALSWKGFPYAVAIIFVYLLFHMLVNKFRRIDNTAIGITLLIAVSIMMLVSLPYYMAMGFMNWYEAPAILFAGICLVIAVFLFTRDLPWLLILPVLLLIIVVSLTVVWYALPDVWLNVFSGAGYFIRTKLYGTIAEAQPPDFNRLVFAYGMTTFFLALTAVVLMIKDLPKGWKNDHIFTTIWALVSIYMAVAAIRFMYNATPVFAILAGWMTWEIMAKLDYKRMIRVFRSMKGDFIKALKYSVKLRHVGGAVFMAFLILAPNMWHGVDAGIPYEEKKEYDLAIYNSLPEFMRPSKDLYNPDSNSLWYLGSFGTSFMSDYWAQGMWWLADQDTWLAEEDRPAFISWWDYGHWCVQVGKHPTAADNFQNGVEFAGNFIAAQGEDEANALMLVRLFQLNRKEDLAIEYMGTQLGASATDELLDLFETPTKYEPLIRKYPERYGLKDDDLSGRNTVFIHGTWLVMEKTTPEQRVDMILWYSKELGDSFRYFAVDSRLMPTSYQNTGIFYAPIVLSDNRVNEYIEIVAIYNGNQITLQQAASLPPEEQRNLQYQLVWKRPFFESMFYRCFVGYSGYDQGPDFKDSGIPFITGDLARSPPLPAWNQSNWRVVHRTIHYNPYDAENLSKHPREWKAISYDEAVRHNDAEEGVIDDAIRTISSGVIYIKWYAGAWVNGTVTTESGIPIPGATITVHDDYRFLGGYMGPDFVGIPHGTTTTDENGRYSILAPFGNTTIVASNGGSMDYMTLHERNILNQSNVFISDDAAMRIGEYNYTLDLTVPTAYRNGTLFADTDGNGKYDIGKDRPLGRAKMTLSGVKGTNVTYNITTYADGYFELKDALPGDYKVSAVYKGHRIEDAGAIILAPGEIRRGDVAIGYSSIVGRIDRLDDDEVEGTEVTVRDLDTNETQTAEADNKGDYKFEELLPGNYSVELYIPGTRPINESVTLTAKEGFELNLTLLPVAFIEGKVFAEEDEHRGPESGLVNVTLTFQRLYGGPLVWTTITNETGHYNTSLPTGTYTLYVHESDGERHLAALLTVEVDASDWAYIRDIGLRRAYRVNGTLKRTASDTNMTLVPAGRTPVQIWNDAGRLEVTANSSGIFDVWLPTGNYSFLTSKAISNRPRLNLTYVNVTEADIDMDEMVLNNGTRLEGSVFFDVNGNDAVNSGEGLGEIDLVFSWQHHSFNTTTAANGTYSLVAAPLNYTITIDAPGFEPLTSHINATGNVLPTKKNLALQPYNVTYSGIAGFDWDEDGNLSGDGFPGLVISFMPVDDGTNAQAINATTDAEGRYNVSIAPGEYKVKVLLDREEELGTFRYRLEEEKNIKPSTEDMTYNLWLERLIRINGTLRLDDNATISVATNIRVDESDKRIQVRSSKFDEFMTTGEHLLTASYYRSMANDEIVRYELELKMQFDRAVSLNLTMYRVVELKGILYYDKNDNGVYDPKDPEDPLDEGEEKHMPRFVLRGIKDHEVYPFVNGSFEASVYPYPNYTLYLERTERDNADNVDYQWYLDGIIDLTSDTTMNIALKRRLEVTGKVFWDRNEDNKSSPEEGIEGANVTIRSRDGTLVYNTTTRTQGNYAQWLEVDTKGKGEYTVAVSHPGFEPNQTEWELDIAPREKTLDLVMHPINVTINGTTFIDLNENGKKDRYELTVRVDHIEVWDTTNRSVHHTTFSDANGSFSLELAPGDYEIYAWTEVDGGKLVYLSRLVVEPIGKTQDNAAPMRPGRMVSGTMYYHNHTGANHTVGEVNLTFTQLDGNGVLPILPADSGTFSATLPEGRYRVNGTFKDEEFGVDMRYAIDEDFRVVLKDRTDLELNFSKLKDYILEMWWEERPIHLDQNESINLTVYARNAGSENATFDLSMKVDNEWQWEMEVDNVTLNLSESTSFWVLITSWERADAVLPHANTVIATPRGITGSDPSELEITILVNQKYGFVIGDAPGGIGFYSYDEVRKERRVTYNFQLKNEGNGKEVINLTTSSIPGWTIELPMSEIELEPYKVDSHIIIEAIIPDIEELRPQTLTITAKALNDPDRPVKTHTLELGFPELTIKPKDIGGEVEGEPLRWPKENAPGFGTLVALAALAAVAFAARRRRGW